MKYLCVVVGISLLAASALAQQRPRVFRCQRRSTATKNLAPLFSRQFPSARATVARRLDELLRKESTRKSDDPAAQVFAVRTMVDWATSASPAGTIPADEAEVMSYSMSYIDGLGLPRPDLLGVLRKWIPEIARYSFREVRMQRI